MDESTATHAGGQYKGPTDLCELRPKFAVNPLACFKKKDGRTIFSEIFDKSLISKQKVRRHEIEAWNYETGCGIIKYVMKEGIAPEFALDYHPLLTTPPVAHTPSAEGASQHSPNAVRSLKYLPHGGLVYARYLMCFDGGRYIEQSDSENEMLVVLGHSGHLTGWHYALSTFAEGEASWTEMNWKHTFGDGRQIMASGISLRNKSSEMILAALNPPASCSPTVNISDEKGTTTDKHTFCEYPNDYHQRTTGVEDENAETPRFPLEAAACKTSDSTSNGVPTFERSSVWTFFSVSKCLPSKVTENHDTVSGLCIKADEYFSKANEMLSCRPPKTKEATKQANKILAEIANSFSDWAEDPELSADDKASIHKLIFHAKRLSLQSQLLCARHLLTACRLKGVLDSLPPFEVDFPFAFPIPPRRRKKSTGGDSVILIDPSQSDALDKIEERFEEIKDVTTRLFNTQFCHGTKSYADDPSAILFVKDNPPTSGYCKTSEDCIDLLRMRCEANFALGWYSEAATDSLKAIQLVLPHGDGNMLSGEWQKDGEKRCQLKLEYQRLRSFAQAVKNKERNRLRQKKINFGLL